MGSDSVREKLRDIKSCKQIRVVVNKKT